MLEIRAIGNWFQVEFDSYPNGKASVGQPITCQFFLHRDCRHTFRIS